MELPRRLKYARELAGLTQRELAEKLGLSHGAIGLYELGKREPDLTTLQRIAHALGTSVSYLVGETDDPSPPPSIVVAHQDPQKGGNPGEPIKAATQLIIERAIRNALAELEELLSQREKEKEDPNNS